MGGLKMKKKLFGKILILVLIWVGLTSSSWAGQVVTESLKSWAKEAIEQERALKTISAPNTVAVVYFNNRTGWSELDLLQKGLTLMLITDLSKVKEIQLVERVKVQALVEELELGIAGLVESETVLRVGRLLGVEYLVGGEIIKEEIDQFALTSSLLKMPVEEVSGHAMAKGELLAELFRMEKDLLFEIINKLKIELLPEKEAELRKFLTTDLNALLYLFEGNEQSDLGNYKKAAEYYKKALEEDPNLSQADDFFLELQELGLIPKKKKGSLLRSLRNRTSLTDQLTPEEPIKRARTPKDVMKRQSLLDGCPDDPNKTAPGICGCGVPDTDSDGDEIPDCNDGCPDDPYKTAPGICGCGVPDTDSDGDGTPDCNDGCPTDPYLTEPDPECGCNNEFCK